MAADKMEGGSTFGELLQKDWQYLNTTVKHSLLNKEYLDQDVEDILQETRIRCYEARLRGEDVLPSFMFTVARNVATDIYRKNQRLVLTNIFADRQEDADALKEAFEIEALFSSYRDKLRKAMLMLWRKERKPRYKLIERRWCDGWTPAAVAKEYGLAVRTVYNNTSEAVIKNELEKVWEFL